MILTTIFWETVAISETMFRH